MTPEEVFAQLRDIHAPASVAHGAAAYDIRPIMIVLGATLCVLAARAVWKRMAARRLLSRIDARASHSHQRDRLVRLVGARGRSEVGLPEPEAAFQPPDALTEDGVQRLRRWVLRRIG